MLTRLSPEEIHRLASKTKKAVGVAADKASCHSDYVDAEAAKKLQLVQLRRSSAAE